MDIIELFPTTVGISRVSTKGLDMIMEEGEVSGRVRNIDNETSSNSYLLNSEELRPIKREIEARIMEYVALVYLPKDPQLEMYITQSWLNYTYTGGSHPVHVHPNSIVSGVLYLRVSSKDSIVFFSPKNPGLLDLGVSGTNPLNADSWECGPLSVGDLVLFPSSMPHMVDRVLEGTRISLSFNTYVRGSIGSEDKLTHLKLL